MLINIYIFNIKDIIKIAIFWRFTNNLLLFAAQNVYHFNRNF